MYGTAPDVPDALAVRSGFLARRRRVVPADAIEDVDAASGVIGLRVARDALKSFL
jgi:membrane protein YdbS with pleckstrin-like domain